MTKKNINIPIIFNSTKEETEPHIDNIKFNIHKFTKRKKPSDNRNIVIFPCFSEFGTEILGVLYSIPILLRELQGKYSVVMGWNGRKYLYKHLVDEFWELDKSHQWLRKYSRAFNHYSLNLTKVEKNVTKQGRLISALELGNVAAFPKIFQCPYCKAGILEEENKQVCKSCKMEFKSKGIFNDPERYKKTAVWVPLPSEEKKRLVSKYIKPNSVGITARARTAYGRNLPTIFYERLIALLEEIGYNPIWVGEKESILPCPSPRICDFSSMPEAHDLENTLALVSQLRFTIQYWTASTRLAGLVGTPWILFESPDQIWGGAITPGHEGFRLYLCSRGPGKLVANDFNFIEQNHDLGLDLTKQAVLEVEKRNFDIIVGAVENRKWVEEMSK